MGELGSALGGRGRGVGHRYLSQPEGTFHNRMVPFTTGGVNRYLSQLERELVLFRPTRRVRGAAGMPFPGLGPGWVVF